MRKDANTPDEIAIKVALFTEFIEDAGLVGFFYVIMSFNRGRLKRFKGISNAVEATRITGPLRSNTYSKFC